MSRIAWPLFLLLGACAQEPPRAASADEIQRAVDRAELAAAAAAEKSGFLRGS